MTATVCEAHPAIPRPVRERRYTNRFAEAPKVLAEIAYRRSRQAPWALRRSDSCSGARERDAGWPGALRKLLPSWMCLPKGFRAVVMDVAVGVRKRGAKSARVQRIES